MLFHAGLGARQNSHETTIDTSTSTAGMTNTHTILDEAKPIIDSISFGVKDQMTYGMTRDSGKNQLQRNNCTFWGLSAI